MKPGGWATGLLAAVLALGTASPGAAGEPTNKSGAASASAKSAKPKAAAKAAKKKPKTTASKPKKAAPLPPLDGTSYDYAYDGKDVGHSERAWLGRAFVHKKAAADATKPLPLLVFVHGINSDLIKYRWNGGGNEGDVRRIVSELIESGQVPPMIVAAPSSVVPQNIVVAPTAWMAFDLDHFVEQTAAKLKGVATIDKTRIIVAAHSGGGCNVKGGIATAIKAKNVHTALVIDTCMGTDLASALAQAKKSTNVVVTWQALTWGKRPLTDFRKVFERDVKKTPADAGVLRTLDFMTPKQAMPHDAMVPLTLKKWLPVILPPPAVAVAPAAPATSSPASSATPATSSSPQPSAAPAAPSAPPKAQP